MPANSPPWERPQKSSAPFFALDYSYEDWTDLVVSWGFKPINADFLFSGLYRHGRPSFQALQARQIPKKLRARLESGRIPPARVFDRVEAFPSRDGAVKFLFILGDGAQVESVYMPKGRWSTFCVSSQAGCAMGCTFCATGAMGFRRHLSAGEIIAQVLHMKAYRQAGGNRCSRCNVVFMGMGEPLHNFDNLLTAFKGLTHPRGLGLSHRDIAVSTCGLVPQIERLAVLTHRPRLMVSIAATTDAARSAIMPVNRTYNLEQLLQCLQGFPLQKRETIMLSYVVIAGMNDHPGDARRLAAMSRRFPSLVNLIPMNEHEASPAMKEPDEHALLTFYRRLRETGVFVTIRRSRGRDVGAACGQLITAAG